MRIKAQMGVETPITKAHKRFALMFVATKILKSIQSCETFGGTVGMMKRQMRRCLDGVSAMITRTENDTRELRTFKRFLMEHAAHKQLERALGNRLPFETATVPNEYWDPRGEFQRPPEATDASD